MAEVTKVIDASFRVASESGLLGRIGVPQQSGTAFCTGSHSAHGRLARAGANAQSAASEMLSHLKLRLFENTTIALASRQQCSHE